MTITDEQRAEQFTRIKAAMGLPAETPLASFEGMYGPVENFKYTRLAASPQLGQPGVAGAFIQPLNPDFR
jgi:hypothetical protein